jgi:DegV family protein with EDD domain
MRARVRVVTDSTAVLPAEVVAEAELRVVPLTVIISGEQGREGIDITPADVARALGERRQSVTTSRPAPAEFAEVYQELLGADAAGVVSVHISGRLSGTHEAAALAATEVGDRVRVVDSMAAGSGIGFVALAAAEAAAAGADLAGVEQAAGDAVERVETYFYVDTLEHLRRGGRIGALRALVGTALAFKPILHVQRGDVVLHEKVRTTARALARLVELAVAAAGESDVDIAVQHLDAQERATDLLQQLKAQLGDRLHRAFVSDVGAVIGAHTGPGAIGVTVHRRV